jgi:hypothetical protein
VAVVTEEVQALVGMEQQLEAVVTLWKKKQRLWSDEIEARGEPHKFRVKPRAKHSKRLSFIKIEFHPILYRLLSSFSGFHRRKESSLRSLSAIKQDILFPSAFFNRHEYFSESKRKEKRNVFLYNSIYYPVGDFATRRCAMRGRSAQNN